MKYKIEILDCSVISNQKSLDVDASNSFQAAKIAAVEIFGQTFVESDFCVERVLKYKFFNTNKFQVKHKRMDLVACLLEINTA